MISYTCLYHRHELGASFKSSWGEVKKFFKKSKHGEEDEDNLAEDVHWRLMKRYREVPDWWYLIVLLIALGIGMAGVAAYPTFVTPAVVPYGILLALIFMIPIGLVSIGAMHGGVLPRSGLSFSFHLGFNPKTRRFSGALVRCLLTHHRSTPSLASKSL